MRLLGLIVLIAALQFAAAADTLQLKQECTISFMGKVYVLGPCGVTI